jgi:hypothetical protein
MAHTNVPSYSCLTRLRMFSNTHMLSLLFGRPPALTSLQAPISYSLVLSLATRVRSSLLSLKHRPLLPIKSSAILWPSTLSLRNTLKPSRPLSHHLAASLCSSPSSPTCPLSGHPSPLLNGVLHPSLTTASHSHTLDSSVPPHLLQHVRIRTLAAMHSRAMRNYHLKYLLLLTETPGLTSFETIPNQLL